MVRVYQNAGKGSLDYVLNPAAGGSFDWNKVASSLPQGPSNEAGFDQLLHAASLLGKRSQPSASSSETASTSKYHTARISDQEVTQPIKAKRRKRKDIKCQECGRTFGDSSSARKHHRVVHLKIKEFKCEECGKSFAEKSNKSKHYIAAHLNQRSHPCPDCDKVFNFTDGLRRHRNNVHLNLRPYHCNACKTSYKQKTHLLKHQQSVHGIPIPPKKTS